MKKIIFMICTVLLIAGCGNKEEKKNLDELLIGEWHSTSLSISDAYTYAGEVYIGFNADKTFDLYQKIGEGAFRLYRGSWNIDGDVLAGKYNDGEEWGTRYQISIDGKTLTMKYSIHDSEVTSVYTSAVIPSEVKIGCEVVVKSEGAGF
jgi:hypothetical protein